MSMIFCPIYNWRILFFGFETGIETSVMEDDEAGRSYLRRCFLATGTVRDPEKAVIN